MDGRTPAKPASAAAEAAHNFTTNAGTRTRAGLIFFEVSPCSMVLFGCHPAMHGNNEEFSASVQKRRRTRAVRLASAAAFGNDRPDEPCAGGIEAADRGSPGPGRDGEAPGVEQITTG